MYLLVVKYSEVYALKTSHIFPLLYPQKSCKMIQDSQQYVFIKDSIVSIYCTQILHAQTYHSE